MSLWNPCWWLFKKYDNFYSFFYFIYTALEIFFQDASLLEASGWASDIYPHTICLAYLQKIYDPGSRGLSKCSLTMGPLDRALWLMVEHGVAWCLVWYKSIASLCGKQFLSLVYCGSAGSSQGEWMMPQSTRVAQGLCETFLQIEQWHIYF